MQFELTKEFLDHLNNAVAAGAEQEVLMLIQDLHPADIAEILDEVDLEEAMYVIKLLDSETTSDVLMELDEDNREKVLRNLSAKEIAEEIKKYIPNFRISYQQDFRQQIANSWPESIDDSEARKDWNWRHKFDLTSMTKEIIKNLKNSNLIP